MISMDKINTKYQDIMNSFVLNIMFHHVGVLWIMKTHEQLQYVLDKHES